MVVAAAGKWFAAAHHSSTYRVVAAGAEAAHSALDCKVAALAVVHSQPALRTCSVAKSSDPVGIAERTARSKLVMGEPARSPGETWVALGMTHGGCIVGEQAGMVGIDVVAGVAGTVGTAGVAVEELGAVTAAEAEEEPAVESKCGIQCRFAGSAESSAERLARGCAGSCDASDVVCR